MKKKEQPKEHKHENMNKSDFGKYWNMAEDGLKKEDYKNEPEYWN